MGIGSSLLFAFPKTVISLTPPTQPTEFLEPDSIKAQELYDSWLLAQRRTNKYQYCSCVLVARALSGIDVGPIGVAKNHPINSSEPRIGAIVVTSEGPVGHLAVVTEVNSDSITVREGNYQRCKLTSRSISINDPRIRGYYAKTN